MGKNGRYCEDLTPEKDRHIRVLLADPGAGSKLRGRTILNCKAVKGHYLKLKAGEFRKTGLFSGLFSM
jgi:hypothetical protein